MRDHVVYRAYGEDGRLLYVGMSSNLPARLYNHGRRSAWWAEMTRFEVERCQSREHALWREAGLIRDLRPTFNIRPGDAWAMPVGQFNPRPAPPSKSSQGPWDEQIIRLRKQHRTQAEIQTITGLSWEELCRIIKRLLATGKIERTYGSAAYRRSDQHAP